MALVELQQVYKEYRLGETCIAALQGIDLTDAQITDTGALMLRVFQELRRVV